MGGNPVAATAPSIIRGWFIHTCCSNRRGDAKQQQVGHDAVHEVLVLEDGLRIAAGDHHHGERTLSVGVPFNEPLCEPTDAVENALKHRVACVATEWLVGGRLEADLWKRVGVFMQRAKLHRGARRDGTAVKCALAIDEVDRDGSPRIDDNTGLLESCVCSGRTEQSVDASGGIWINTGRHGRHDVLADHSNLDVQLSLGSRAKWIGERAIHAGHGHHCIAALHLLQVVGDAFKQRVDLVVGDALARVELPPQIVEATNLRAGIAN